MTVVLKNVQRTAGAKPIVDDLVVAMDRNTSQILIFDDSQRKSDVRVPLDLMADRSSLSFYTNLLDCNVDICSPELMVQFSDNFDYQVRPSLCPILSVLSTTLCINDKDIRRDFIRNEVGNIALGKHIYGYMIQVDLVAYPPFFLLA